MSRYQNIAETAAQYALEKLSHGASNVENAAPQTIIKVSQARAFLLNRSPGPYSVALIKQIALGAIEAGAGNCGELASVAFEYLHRRGIRPLDFVSYTRGDHAFVIIGRPAGTDIQQPGGSGWSSAWGSTTVICDPWASLNGVAPVTLMADYEARYETYHVVSNLRVELDRAMESPF